MATKKPRPVVFTNGWVPDQHGSWAMALMPLIAGVILAQKTWALAVLALAWVSGYFLFSVSEKYIKSRFRPRYRYAVSVYAVLAALFTAVLVSALPHLLWWALVYVPLIGYWAWSVWQRRERDLAPRFATIAASSVVVPVAVNTGVHRAWFDGFDAHAWLIALVLGVYFALTVPYVKTLIRERGKRNWRLGSVVAHVLAAAGVVVLSFFDVVSTFHALVWIVLAGRAALMPFLAFRRGRPWRPAVVGVIEVVLSLLVFASLPW